MIIAHILLCLWQNENKPHPQQHTPYPYPANTPNTRLTSGKSHFLDDFSEVAVVSTTQVMTCPQSALTDQQGALEAFEIIEVEEGEKMEKMDNSFRSMTLSRVTGTLKSRKSTSVSSSVDSGLENEYTHVPNGLPGVYPTMWVKIKYPIEVDDASPNGMLSPSDLDAVLQGIQQVMYMHVVLLLVIFVIG